MSANAAPNKPRSQQGTTSGLRTRRLPAPDAAEEVRQPQPPTPEPVAAPPRLEPGQDYAEGTLEVLPDGYGFLRRPERNYLGSPQDVYVSPAQITRLGL